MNLSLDTLYLGFLGGGDPGGFQERVDSKRIGPEETSRLVESQAHHYIDD